MTSSRYEVVSECDGRKTEEGLFVEFAKEAALLLPEGSLIITQHGDPESLEDLIRGEEEPGDFLYNHYSERLHKDGYHYAWRDDTGGLGFAIYRKRQRFVRSQLLKRSPIQTRNATGTRPTTR